MYIVAFNGPPQSGKDTLAGMLADLLDSKTDLPVRIDHLSKPLRRIAYQMVGWNYSDSETNYEDFKKMHFEEFNCSGRQLMIDISESFLKPSYGKEIMAKMFIQRNAGFDGILIVADSGFQLEVNPLAAAVGGENLVVFNVHRCSLDFTGDSREWVNHTYQSALYNNGTLGDLRSQAARAYSRMVNQLKWKL